MKQDAQFLTLSIRAAQQLLIDGSSCGKVDCGAGPPGNFVDQHTEHHLRQFWHQQSGADVAAASSGQYGLVLSSPPGLRLDADASLLVGLYGDIDVTTETSWQTSPRGRDVALPAVSSSMSVLPCGTSTAAGEDAARHSNFDGSSAEAQLLPAHALEKDEPLAAENGVATATFDDLPAGLTLEDVTDIRKQLSCSTAVAIKTYEEMNITIVMDELHCDRTWALTLLKRHDFDPCLVRMRETDFNQLCIGHDHDSDFKLTEMRTTWGTTVPVDTADIETVFCVGGRYIRATDPDYLKFEWVEGVQPLRDKSAHAIRESRHATAARDDSTAASSDGERSVRSTMSESPSELGQGEFVSIIGLQSALELNGRRGQIVRFVPESSRYEVQIEGTAGTKGLRAANLRRVD